MKKVLQLVFVVSLYSLVCGMFIGAGVAVEGCTKQQEAAGITVASTGFSCAKDIGTLIVTGSEDPVQVAQDCGLTLVQLIALIDSIVNPAQDAGAMATKYTPEQIAAFTKVHDKAVSMYAMKHKVQGACVTVVVAGLDGGSGPGK